MKNLGTHYQRVNHALRSLGMQKRF
jgi:hypothetical protein